VIVLRTTVAAFVVLAALAAQSAGGQAISIANEPLVAATGADTVEIYIRTSGRPRGKPKQLLSLTDLTVSATDRFSETEPAKEVAAIGRAILWRTVWKLGDNPRWTKTRHVYLATWGHTSQLLNISVARQDDGPVHFTVSSASLRTRYDVPLTIQAIASYAIDSPEVQVSTLMDSRTGRSLDKNSFKIERCAQSAPKPDGSSQQIVTLLCLDRNGAAVPPGKYDGALVLGTSARDNLGSIVLTVYSTSICDQALGLLCLFLGLACFFAFSVVLKGYNRRLTTLLPPARLLDEVIALKQSVESAAQTAGVQFPHILDQGAAPGSLLQLEESLSKKGLKKSGYLPQLIANPFAQPELSSDYRAFLTSSSNKLESLKLIVRWGVDSVMRSWSELAQLGIETRGQVALDALDRLALTAGGPLQLLTNQIQTILDTFESEIAKAHSAKALGGAPPPTNFGLPVLTAQHISIQLEQLSIIGWVLWAVITLLVGSCALVWFNDGFGIGRDYVQCFLWGIGLPAIAQGFGGLNASSAASALSLQIPR
jgi:hypothetical protein